MEPHYSRARAATPLLMMESAPDYESLEITFLEAGRRYSVEDYDCVIPAEGAIVWSPQSAALRMLVVGQKDRLTRQQADQLNDLISSLQKSAGLDPNSIRLARGTDPRTSKVVPVGAQDMAALLRRNGIIH